MSPTHSLPPFSGSIVNLSIINAGNLSGSPSFFTDAPIPGHDSWVIPTHSFLIENDKAGKKVLFDLGLRKDVESTLAARDTPNGGFTFEILQDVAEQLTNASITLDSIDSIIWSHSHIDHTGDPSLFPNTTSLIVGPGFKSNPQTYPGYPLNPNSTVAQDAFDGRELIEVSFNTSLTIGGFNAIDFFNDGSFYLLQAPGHTLDHMAGLARTSKGKFVLLGADTAHYNGLFRPNDLVRLPHSIKPSPFKDLHSHSSCPGSIFEPIHPATARGEDYRTTPFYELSSKVTVSLEDAGVTLGKVQVLDANPDVLVVIAHDNTAPEILPYFPAKLNGWEKKDYKQLDTWRFLRDFKKALKL